MSEKLPPDIEERLKTGAPWERNYWDDWIYAIAEVGKYDEQIQNLRNAGHLGSILPDYEEEKEK